MRFIEGEIYHVYNRGNNKQPIFFTRENYLFFLAKIRKELLPYCDIISYCLMPNHFHLEVFIKPLPLAMSSHSTERQPAGKTFNNGLAILLRSYTRAIHRQQNITGSLFQQKTKARLLNNGRANETINEALVCMNYIHQNAVKGGLVKSVEQWEFSSYLDYANLRDGTLCNKQLGFEVTGVQESTFVDESREMATAYFEFINVDKTD
jgi:putative transposase